ncbi:MAG TPA: Arc family DNA-binding protein [Stellaceae bacterium]|nr:Arc family DNA-binding protein [Stellaceae bacterium]
MPVNLSIKNTPDRIVNRLKQRAKRNHRSLQGELLAIVEEAVTTDRRKMTPAQVLAKVRSLGLQTPSESVAMIRRDRAR